MQAQFELLQRAKRLEVVRLDAADSEDALGADGDAVGLALTFAEIDDRDDLARFLLAVNVGLISGHRLGSRSEVEGSFVGRGHRP